jgi:hypothetical protein
MSDRPTGKSAIGALVYLQALASIMDKLGKSGYLELEQQTVLKQIQTHYKSKRRNAMKDDPLMPKANAGKVKGAIAMKRRLKAIAGLVSEEGGMQGEEGPMDAGEGGDGGGIVQLLLGLQGGGEGGEGGEEGQSGGGVGDRGARELWEFSEDEDSDEEESSDEEDGSDEEESPPPPTKKQRCRR